MLLGHRSTLLVGRAGRPAQGLTLRLRTLQAGPSTLHQQISLHFGGGSSHVQNELAGGADQVELAHLQAIDLDAVYGQRLDRGADVLSIAVEEEFAHISNLRYCIEKRVRYFCNLNIEVSA